MCGLCGLIGEEAEWSDGLHSSLPKRRNRLRRILFINHVIKPYRLNITDFQGVNYLVETLTGKQGIANGLNNLWDEIEKLTGREIDVLDPLILNHLELSN